MTIIDRLNAGEFHDAARKRNPDCVDAKGNIHATPERARFVNWREKMKGLYGDDVKAWPPIARDEYTVRYVPSH